MEQDDLLRAAVGALERLELRYFVTGSMATIFYGEPRFTNVCRTSPRSTRAASPAGIGCVPRRASRPPLPRSKT